MEQATSANPARGDIRELSVAESGIVGGGDWGGAIFGAAMGFMEGGLAGAAVGGLIGHVLLD